MTTFKQWAANRENAQKSTGPKTEQGKCRSRRNALRHGMTAETVINGLEDIEDYRAFEAAIIADYDATTAVERELVLRLASLMWRIRRATGIETDLLRIQAEILHDRETARELSARSEPHAHDGAYQLLRAVTHPAPSGYWRNGCTIAHPAPLESHDSGNPMRRLTRCFLCLSNSDNGAFERLGRYEAALWRQIVQTLFALEAQTRAQRRSRFMR